MNLKLYRFFFGNRSERWRAYIWIIAFVSTFGVVNGVVLKQAESTVSYEAVCLLVLCLIVSALRHGGAQEMKHKHREVAARPYRVSARLAWTGIVGAITLITTASIPASRFEAYILEARLRHVAHETSGAAPYEEMLKKVSSAPTRLESSQGAKKVIATAQSHNVRINPSVLTQTAVRFLDAADKNPEAWGVTTELLAYRSFLNRDTEPALRESADCTSEYQSVTLLDVSVLNGTEIRNFKPNPARPLVKVECVRGENLPTERTARLELLGVLYNYPGIPKEQQLQPPKENREIAFFRISVGWNVALVLGNTYMKNVVIENTTVEYAGGPVILDNVWFVNCKFILKQNDEVKQFSTQVLASVPANFRAGPS